MSRRRETIYLTVEGDGKSHNGDREFSGRFMPDDHDSKHWKRWKSRSTIERSNRFVFNVVPGETMASAKITIRRNRSRVAIPIESISLAKPRGQGTRRGGTPGISPKNAHCPRNTHEIAFFMTMLGVLTPGLLIGITSD